MPFHLLDFLGLDLHNHHHDDADSYLNHHNDVHSPHHDGVHLHQQHHAPSDVSFLSTPEPHACRRPVRLTPGDDLPTSFLSHSPGVAKLSVTARQAAAFLDSGLTGLAGTHASASSFLSIQKSLTEVVQATPPAALVPLHALSIVGAVPGHVAFELGEGFLFGFQKGFALALTGKLLGSAAAFGIGRSAVACGCLKDRLKEQMEKWPLCQKVCKGVERGGGFSVFVIRMAPVPCVVKNYAPALLTDIPFSAYVIASFAGLVPTTAAHVYVGNLAPSAAALASGTAHISGVQAVTLASPVVAGVCLTAFAGYYLHKHVLESDDAENRENEEEDSCNFEKIKVN